MKARKLIEVEFNAKKWLMNNPSYKLVDFGQGQFNVYCNGIRLGLVSDWRHHRLGYRAMFKGKYANMNFKTINHAAQWLIKQQRNYDLQNQR